MMKRMSLLAILFSILCAPAAFAADRLRVAYSSISAAYTGIWVAHDAGFFAKETTLPPPQRLLSTMFQ
jgi:ABC-type nitrate/sulfonate/bicarbonate transport system substrate-binding protein